MKKTLLLGALLAATPLSLLLPGCSGGSNNAFNPSPTSAPTSTTRTSNFTLGNGQRAILTTIQVGSGLTGTLQIVPSPVALAKKSAAIPFQFAFGSYAITGTVTPGGAFTISGNLGTFGAFSMTGQLQSATTDGNYTLTVNGQTETGVLPKSGPTTTPTPSPTNPGSGNFTGNLVFSNVSAGSEIISTPITSFSDLKSSGALTSTIIGTAKAQTLALNGSNGPITGNGVTRLVQLTLSSYTTADITGNNIKPFSVGQNVTLNPFNSILQFSQTTVLGTAISIKVWRSVSGTVQIKAIGTNSATVELKNVRIDPSPIFGGTGSFTLNGTLTGTGLTVTNP